MKRKTCNRFKALLTDSLYDELREKDKGFFQSHLETCPACANEYEEMSGVLRIMDKRRQPEMSEAFWDNWLPQLREKTGQTETGWTGSKSTGWLNSWNKWWRDIHSNLNLRWVMYPAAALLLVVSGIVIGKFLYSPQGRELVRDPASLVRTTRAGVSEHFDNLRPVLTDYSNYSPAESASDKGDMVWMDRETLQRLVVENHLLKKAAARSKDASLKRLLGDLEMILIEISSSSPNASRNETARMVRDMLKDNDILFKMKVYRKNQERRPSPSI
jgi:hypothetical protein